MRGPGLHVSPDLRRKWRCPSCGRERLVAQTETTVVCRCQDPPKFMQLVEGKRVVRPEPVPVAHFYEEDDLPPDEIDPNAVPGDPSIQSVPAPRPPRPPRPQRPQGEQQGDRPRQGDQRPPRDKGRPQDRQRGPGGPGPRPPMPASDPGTTQQAPVNPVVESTPSNSPGAESGDHPKKKKRRRNRDRNRSEGGPTSDSTPESPPQDAPRPPQDEFGAGL